MVNVLSLWTGEFGVRTPAEAWTMTKKEEQALFIPISRPTDATSDRFLFCIYMCFLTRECRRQTQIQKLEAVCTVRDASWDTLYI
jgi:hypothetical protein